jgi:hypothetical protein
MIGGHGRSVDVMWIRTAVLACAVLAGCGSAGQQSEPVGPAVAGGAGDGLRSIARAVVDLSIRTHQGAESIKGIRVTGTCVSGGIGLTVGHAAPYEPLRKTYIPQIDAVVPAQRYRLHARCDHGRFRIHRGAWFVVRLGRGPLTVEGAHRPAISRAVMVPRQGIE